MRAGQARRTARKLSQAVITLVRDRLARRIALQGERNLMDQPEFQSSERLAPVLSAFSGGGEILEILKGIQDTSTEPRVWIGGDLPDKEMQQCALVAARFENMGTSNGLVAIVGPRRMPYGRVIPLIRFTASVLSGRV